MRESLRSWNYELMSFLSSQGADCKVNLIYFFLLVTLILSTSMIHSINGRTHLLNLIDTPVCVSRGEVAASFLTILNRVMLISHGKLVARWQLARVHCYLYVVSRALFPNLRCWNINIRVGRCKPGCASSIHICFSHCQRKRADDYSCIEQGLLLVPLASLYL